MKKFRLYFDTDKEVVWLNQMAEAGYVFFLSANGVWQTRTVPAQYLSLDLRT